ncbi:YdcF family protein [Tropicimonas sp. IMCC6043]|uniref:YdcF family protein n=1 Tax=Tropicimonas sp. IMCC6043 TaxID=2510645 RepID=UPI00101BEAD9|nr:YdcF family protein [Tropicimonas sp. IMCC6043]RYH08219.1 YdcF family protein [Tropicimonas sp. IMCC6043]
MDTLFFIASKLVWGVLQPQTWLLVGAALACLAAWRGRLRATRALTSLLLALILAIGTLPVADGLLASLESRYPANPPVENVTGILVLGGGERWPRHGQPQVNEGGERFIEAISLARRFPEAHVVFSGGSGALRDLGTVPGKSAETAELIFRGAGIAPERLTFENASRNTAENAAFTLDLVTPTQGDTWLLVTSAFHMPRAYRSFERAGWPGLVAWPVDFRAAGGVHLGWFLPENLLGLDIALKEYLGLVVYGVTRR